MYVRQLIIVTPKKLVGKKNETFVYVNINLKNIICLKDFFPFYLLLRSIYTFQYNCSCMRVMHTHNQTTKKM